MLHSSLARLALPVALALFVAAPAAAQSSACYKGSCAGLDTTAVGANYGWLDGFALPTRTGGVSGGEVDASYLGRTQFGPCLGFATVLPDHIVEVSTFQRAMVLEVAASQDTVLLVHGPDGWRCNDDTVGNNPLIGGSWSAGTYRVWVANYSQGHADYTLDLRAARRGETWVQPDPPTTTPPVTPAQVLDVGASDAAHESLIVRPGDPAALLEGRAGGALDVQPMVDSEGTECFGFTHAQPDHIVTLTDRFEDLRLSVESDIDTTLLVHGPHGWLCNDDAIGMHPALVGSLPPGTYRVWIGSYNAQQTSRYRLTVDSGAAVVVPPPVVGPTYSFRGRFEGLDVAFEGASLDEVHASCQRFAASSDQLDWVDDVTMFGATAHNASAYWEEGALCAMVALNARPDLDLPMGVEGNVEGIPFGVAALDAPTAIPRYLPVAIGDQWLDDLTVNGAAARNSSGYWSADEVVAIVLGSLDTVGGSLVAAGNAEGVPFRFTGFSAADIQQQCAAFAESALDDVWIDDVVVNGQSRHNSSGWWQPTDLCMLISSLAQAR